MTNANQKLEDLTLISGSARFVALLLFLVSLLFALPCLAQNPSPSCTPPSTQHPTLQQAIDDPGCPTIHLLAQTYGESILISRSLELKGAGLASSTVDGSITVTGASTQVSLSEMGVLRNCTVPGIQITMGAQITTSNVEIRTVAIECPELHGLPFSDGFEDV